MVRVTRRTSLAVNSSSAAVKTPQSQKKNLRRTRKISTSSESEDSPTKIRDNLDVSPSKIKKSDNLSGAECLIEKLNIIDEKAAPDTPRRRNKYQNARQVLNSTETQNLPGRETEYAELIEFLETHHKNKTSGSLYVSGQPGTGKTACMSKILNSKEYEVKFKKVYINCTSVTGSIYKKICAELNIKIDEQKTEKDFLSLIDNFLSKNHKIILMVLDEIDYLIGKKQSILYTIFEWPSKKNSKIVLVGIANALDLTDRLLTRLNSTCELKPKLLHFAPYNKQQIIDIFKQRLEDAGVLEIFPQSTIQLLAAKVSAVSGDVRRALDIGRRVVEIAAQQKRGKRELGDLVLKEIINEEDEKMQPVQLSQVMSVLKNVYGTSENLDDEMENSFPLTHKILICTLLLILKADKNKDITLGRLHDVFTKVCKKIRITLLDQSEFVGLCDLVEARGILRVQKKKEARLHKICLQWDETEVTTALQDKQLIASILSDTSVLNK